MVFNSTLFFGDIWHIAIAVPNTLLMASIILVISILIGTLFACFNRYGKVGLSMLSELYTGYVRSMPLLVHIYILFQLMERLFSSQNVPHTPLAILIYSFYVGANQAENIKGALRSVPYGQLDAAYAIGMTRCQAMLRIIFPQAVRVVLPAFLNSYLSIIKGLSLVFTLGIVDIFAQAKITAVEEYGYIEAYLAAAVIYWGISVGLTLLFTKINAYFDREVAAI